MTNEFDNNATTASNAPEKCSPWFLLAMPIGVGLVLGVIVTFIRALSQVDTRSIYLGLDGMRMPLALIAFTIVASFIAILWYRPKAKTIALIAGLLIATGFTLYKTVRIESFYGNMIPRLAWRWSPTAEEQIKSYLVSSNGVRKPVEKTDIFAPRDRDFPGFLGKNRNATVDGVQLACNWDQNPPKLLWRHPVGLGWSSFAIVGSAAVNLEQRDASECVVCYRLETGEELWCHEEPARFEDEHGDGPRSTPTIVDGRVFSMGANGTLTCIELATGNLLWKRETLNDPDKQNLLWGMSGSPLIYDGQVLVTPALVKVDPPFPIRLQQVTKFGEPAMTAQDTPRRSKQRSAANVSCSASTVQAFDPTQLTERHCGSTLG